MRHGASPRLGCRWRHGALLQVVLSTDPPSKSRFLGTSGQNISDIFKYSSMDDYLEILEWTLLAGHISPTAPDTLGKGLRVPVPRRGVRGRIPQLTLLLQAATPSTTRIPSSSPTAHTSTSAATRPGSSPSC